MSAPALFLLILAITGVTAIGLLIVYAILHALCDGISAGLRNTFGHGGRA